MKCPELSTNTRRAQQDQHEDHPETIPGSAGPPTKPLERTAELTRVSNELSRTHRFSCTDVSPTSLVSATICPERRVCALQKRSHPTFPFSQSSLIRPRRRQSLNRCNGKISKSGDVFQIASCDIKGNFFRRNVRSCPDPALPGPARSCQVLSMMIGRNNHAPTQIARKIMA